MNKIKNTLADAVASIPSGASIAVGGFGLCGIPAGLIEALLDQGADDLRIVSNNCGVDGAGLGLLLEAGRVSRTTSSYVGENKEFERQYLSGELVVELVPQGTLAERLRAGGAGIPAFYTPAGVGTQVSAGGLPLLYAQAKSDPPASPTPQLLTPPREIRKFEGREYVLEKAIVCDFALVHARYGDRHGNLVYEKSAMNFNPLCATAGRVTIAEVEEIVEPGELDPMLVHTPGIFVQRVVQVVSDKKIERRTVRA